MSEPFQGPVFKSGLDLQVNINSSIFTVNMNALIYTIEVEERVPRNWCSNTQSELDQPAATILLHSTSGFLQCCSSTYTLATFWEILLASFSSLITSTYTLNHEDQVSFQYNRRTWADHFFQGFNLSRLSEDFHSEEFDLKSSIVDPSPALMLSCCLILGCSVSSFIYRRQEHDQFQTPFFVLVTTFAVTFGIGMHLHSNLIMLALIPWALCFAMITSSLGHWVLRRCGMQRPKTFYGIDENEVLIRKC